MKIFSERLRELREQKKLSMNSLAQKIGVSDAAICKWENGTNEPKASYITLLADFFEVSTDYLLGLEDELGVKKYSAPINKDAELPSDAQELVDMFLKLVPDLRHRALTYIKNLVDISEEEKRLKTNKQ